jgi:hypothetical protein
LVQNLWGHVNFEGHYFSGNENNLGYTAGSWAFDGEHWMLSPGIGIIFGAQKFDEGFSFDPKRKSKDHRAVLN